MSWNGSTFTQPDSISSKAGTLSFGRSAPDTFGIRSSIYTVQGTTYDASGAPNAFSATGSTQPVQLTQDGIYTVNYALTDNTGFTTPTATATITIDNHAPAVTINPQFDSEKWYGSTASAVWTAAITNNIPNFSSGTYQIGYSPTPVAGLSAASFSTLTSVVGPTPVTSDPITLPNGTSSSGYYYLLVNASNKAGLSATPVVSGPFQYDATGPTMGTATTNYPGDGTLAVSWTAASDTVSGLPASPYSLSYTVGGQTFTAVQNTAATSAAVPLSGIYGQTVTLTLTAVNNAGVPSTASTTVVIPPHLSMTASSAGINGAAMEVDLDFPNLSPKQLHDGFTSLAVTRTLSGAGGATLPALSIDPTAIALNPDGTLNTSASANTNWKTDASGNIEYVDLIPVASGAGHKSWSYALSATPSTDVIAPQTVVLPNNPGTVTMQIEDMSGNVYSPGSSAFHVYADGKVQIVIAGTDPDQDHWDYEIDRVTQTGPLTAYKSLSGTALLDYDGTAAGTPSAPTTITLRQGINNLSVFWEEGHASGAVFHSAVESIDLEPGPSGTYTISVTNQYQNPANSDATGILTSPGAALNFSLDTSGLDPSVVPGITWTWNDWNPSDGSATSNGATATHAYGQSPSQTGDQTVYTLSLAIPGVSSPVTLNVTVQDTQEGPLLESETWHGAHTVTGVVTVPAGLSLTVAPQAAVQFAGGLGSGFGQGLDIQGTFSAGDGAVFGQAAGQTQNWGTILVEGTASLGAATVTGAAQALSVTSGGSLRLTGTQLTGNLTGLHVTGDSVNSPSVQVTGATIAGNTVYGIKEDAAGRPQLSGTSITGNFRNYYSYDQNLLTIDQINALNTQAAAPNTGDANGGTDE